jgi:hypothetical protein
MADNSKRTAFWKRDSDDANRISYLLLQTDKLSIDVGLHNSYFYYPYFIHLKAIFRNVKPVAKGTGFDIKPLKNKFEKVGAKVFALDKTPSKFENLSKALVNIADELDELHDDLLDALAECGLYIRTTTEFGGGVPVSDRVRLSGKTKRNK